MSSPEFAIVRGIREARSDVHALAVIRQAVDRGEQQDVVECACRVFWERLFNEHFADLVAELVNNLPRRAENAEECAEQAIWKLAYDEVRQRDAEGAYRFRPERPDAIVAWLKKTAKNDAYDALRQVKRKEERLGKIAEARPTDQATASRPAISSLLGELAVASVESMKQNDSNDSQVKHIASIKLVFRADTGQIPEINERCRRKQETTCRRCTPKHGGSEFIAQALGVTTAMVSRYRAEYENRIRGTLAQFEEWIGRPLDRAPVIEGEDDSAGLWTSRQGRELLEEACSQIRQHCQNVNVPDIIPLQLPTNKMGDFLLQLLNEFTALRLKSSALSKQVAAIEDSLRNVAAHDLRHDRDTALTLVDRMKTLVKQDGVPLEVQLTFWVSTAILHDHVAADFESLAEEPQFDEGSGLQRDDQAVRANLLIQAKNELEKGLRSLRLAMERLVDHARRHTHRSLTARTWHQLAVLTRRLGEVLESLGDRDAATDQIIETRAIIESNLLPLCDRVDHKLTATHQKLNCDLLLSRTIGDTDALAQLDELESRYRQLIESWQTLEALCVESEPELDTTTKGNGAPTAHVAAGIKFLSVNAHENISLLDVQFRQAYEHRRLAWVHAFRAERLTDGDEKKQEQHKSREYLEQADGIAENTGFFRYRAEITRDRLGRLKRMAEPFVR